jgi:hypothetical protein
LAGLAGIAGVADTAKNFWAVSLKPAINFRLFVFSNRYQQHRGKMLSPVSLTPAINCSPVSTTPPVINCIDDRGLLLLLQNYLWPPKSATAADIVIGTAIKTRKGTSHTLIRGPVGRQIYFNQNGII